MAGDEDIRRVFASLEDEQIRRVISSTLDSSEFHNKLSEAVKLGVTAGMDAWGTALGLNVKDPLEQQADLRHLSKSRKVWESGLMRIFLTAITAGTTGFIAWVGASAAGLFRGSGH